MALTMENIRNGGSNSCPTNEKHHDRKISIFGYIVRFIAWWFGFTALYGAFSVCPFCGQQGCPAGIGTAGFFGMFFSICIQNWKHFIQLIKQKFEK